MINVYDLAKERAEKMSRVHGAAMDWEVLGMLHKLPKGYHFTKQGLPDKRYSNYLEVSAYYEAELEERSEILERVAEETTTYE